jgi:uncharacterized protein with LGFP repeats
MAHTLIRFAASALAAASLLVTAPIASADPSADAVDAIDTHYEMLGQAQSRLGSPVSGTFDVAGGAERDYEGGSIFYSEQTGAKALYGPVLDRYLALGGPSGQLGFPVSDEADAGNGVAHVADFSQPGGAAIYWSPQWGPVVITGAVLDTYRASGGAIGAFSYPSADTTTVNGVETGSFIGPRGTRIQWSNNSGVSTVPAALAGSLPSAKSPAIGAVRTSKWWWMPAALAVGLVVAAVVRLLQRLTQPQAVTVQADCQEMPPRPRMLFTHEDTLSTPLPFG